MTRIKFLKFMYFYRNNITRLIVVNLFFLLPFVLFSHGLWKIVPLVIQYIDSLNVAVIDFSPSYERLTFVVVAPSGETVMENRGMVYAFYKKDFRGIRKYLFTDPSHISTRRVLERRSVGFSPLYAFNEPLEITDRSGNHVATVLVDTIKRGTIEVVFYRFHEPQENRFLVLALIEFFAGLILLGGGLAGVADYVQRMVYHEMRGFSYLFRVIGRHFFRSLLVALFLFIIIAAVASNIYFYIFLINSDISVFIAALNVWMLIFFLFILLWVFPLTVINRDESVWRVMKKSLFLSFDNFEYTMDLFVLVIAGCFISVITAGIFPGISGLFSLLNNALKDISARYSTQDNA